MAKKKTLSFSDSLKDGLKFPWEQPSKLWYILWILVPIFGWLLLIGYIKKIVQELVKGKNKSLPEMGEIWDTFLEGTKAFFFMVPTIIVVSLIDKIIIIGPLLSTIISIFILPWLTIHFFINGKIENLWEIQKAYNVVFGNAKEYVLAFVKTIIFEIIYGILSIVLIGLPCLCFGNAFYLAEFYKENH